MYGGGWPRAAGATGGNVLFAPRRILCAEILYEKGTPYQEPSY